MFTKRLTEQKQTKPSEALILRHFEFQNKHRRGNYLKAGSSILRYIYNSPAGKIDYSSIQTLTKLSKWQAEKFISRLRADKWLLNDKRGFAPINYHRIITLDAELRKQGWLWAFTGCENDNIWRFRTKAHSTCLKKGKKLQAAKIWSYTNDNIRVKILEMVAKGHRAVFQSMEHFENYMAKFLEFELNTKKFLDWVGKKIDQTACNITYLASKIPTELYTFLKGLKQTVSYIVNESRKALFKTNSLIGRKEKEKEVGQKPMVNVSLYLKTQSLLKRLAGPEDKRYYGGLQGNCNNPKSSLTDISKNLSSTTHDYAIYIMENHRLNLDAALKYLDDAKCKDLCFIAKREFSGIAVRGLLMHLNRKRITYGYKPLTFYDSHAVDKFMIILLRQELGKSWQLERHNAEEYRIKQAELKLWRQREIELGQDDKKWYEVNRMRFREKNKSFATYVPKVVNLSSYGSLNDCVAYLSSGGDDEHGGGFKSIGGSVDNLLKGFGFNQPPTPS